MSLSHLPEMRSLVAQIEAAATSVREDNRRTRFYIRIQIAAVAVQLVAVAVLVAR